MAIWDRGTIVYPGPVSPDQPLNWRIDIHTDDRRLAGLATVSKSWQSLMDALGKGNPFVSLCASANLACRFLEDKRMVVNGITVLGRNVQAYSTEWHVASNWVSLGTHDSRSND